MSLAEVKQGQAQSLAPKVVNITSTKVTPKPAVATTPKVYTPQLTHQLTQQGALPPSTPSTPTSPTPVPTPAPPANLSYTPTSWNPPGLVIPGGGGTIPVTPVNPVTPTTPVTPPYYGPSPTPSPPYVAPTPPPIYGPPAPPGYTSPPSYQPSPVVTPSPSTQEWKWGPSSTPVQPPIEQTVTTVPPLNPLERQLVQMGNQPLAKKLYETRVFKKETILNQMPSTIGGAVPLSVKERMLTLTSPNMAPSYIQSIQAVRSAQKGTIISQTKPTYPSVYKEISTARMQAITSKLSPIEKSNILKNLSASEKQIKTYESKGFGVEEVTVPGELAPGQMGPPAPMKVYQFTVPEKAQLDWARYQLQQSGKLPPVIREITQFGQGLVSSGLSIISPVAGLVGQQKGFDIASSIAMTRGSSLNPFDVKQYGKNLAGSIEAGKYGIHYPSTLDVALEPIGWAPKGATQFLAEHPAFAAGGIGGEAVQWIAGGEIIKGASKVAKVGTRFVVPRATSFFGRVEPVLERTFGKTLPSFTRHIGETTVGKNVSLFGKGYEPVAKGVEKIIGSKSSKVVEGATTVTKVARETKLIPTKWYGFAERTFVQKGTAKTLLKPTTEISMTMRPVTKEASILYERTGYKTGIRGITRQYQSVATVSRGAKTYVESGLEGMKGSIYKYGGDITVSGPITGGERVSSKLGQIYKTFSTKTQTSATRPMLESELPFAHPKVQWLHTAVIPSQKGFGIPSVTRQVAKNLSKEASASLMGQPRTVSKLVATGGRVMRGVAPGIPAFIPTSKLVTIIAKAGTYAVAKGEIYQPSYAPPKSITVPITNYKPIQTTHRASIPPQPIFVPITETDMDLDRGIITIPVQHSGSERRTTPIQIERQLSIQRQDLGQRQIVEERHDQFTFQDRFQEQRQDTTFRAPPFPSDYGYRGKLGAPLGGSEAGGYALGGGGGGGLPHVKRYTERTFDVLTLAPTTLVKPFSSGVKVQFKPVVWRTNTPVVKSKSKIPRVL